MTKFWLTVAAISLSQFTGAWVYWKLRAGGLAHGRSDTRARYGAGLATTIVLGATFAAIGVQKYFGDEVPWTACVFLGVLGGAWEALFGRGRLLARFHPNAQSPESG